MKQWIKKMLDRYEEALNLYYEYGAYPMMDLNIYY